MIVVHINLLGNPAEAEMVGNHKGVHPVVFWQVRIGFLELFDLFRIEDMDFPPEPAQTAIFTKSIDQIVPVDGEVASVPITTSLSRIELSADNDSLTTV